MSRKEKFIQRNQKHVDGLLSKVKEHGKNIRCLMVSSEMVMLGEFFDEVVMDDHNREMYNPAIWTVGGNKLIVMVNPYMPSDVIQLVLRDDEDNKIKFDVPCVCGIYSDEEHKLH